MDHPQSSSLIDVLTALPDPRKTRGKHLEWSFIWGIIATAMLSSQRGAAAIAHWSPRHAPSLLAAFQPAKGRLPSEATIRRALHQVDAVALERQMAALDHADSSEDEASPSALNGDAIDGKHVRGAAAHGHPTLLVSLVAHRDARVLAQTAVASKRHESQAVPALLDGRALRGMVDTMDAGLTQAALARQIRAQGGHDLMVVNRNRHQLYDELTTLFATAPRPCDRPWRMARTRNTGHGRLETRTGRCTDDLDGYREWPDVCQVMERDCERIELKTGVVTRAVTYAARVRRWRRPRCRREQASGGSIG